MTLIQASFTPEGASDSFPSHTVAPGEAPERNQVGRILPLSAAPKLAPGSQAP